MKAHFKTAAFIFAGLLSFSAIAQQPSMKSDQDFIQAAVEKHGFFENSNPHGEYYSQKDHVVFDGCAMTVHVVAISADEPPYKRETTKFDVLIDLKKMDPNPVARPTDLNGNPLPVGREWIILKTSDGQEWIEMKREGKLMSASSAWLIQGGTSHEENQKLAEAFGRIIAACRRHP